MRRVVCWAFVFAALAAVLPVGRAADNSDEAAIRAAVASYTEAFNRADAVAVADHWADDAEYVLPDGERVHGKAAVTKVFKKLFSQNQSPKITILKTDIRMLGKDAAIEEGTARIVYSDGDVEDSSYIAIHVRQGKNWKLNTVRETNVPVTPEVPNVQYEHLKELEWLVGSWADDDEAGGMVNRFVWSKNNKFIQGHFRLPTPAGESIEGTLVIGWDEEAGVIRSWMFDAEGGFGEGMWSRGEKSWTVKFTQVLPDGRRSDSTNIYTQLDDNTFTWKTIGRKIDGQFGPNIGPVRATRVRETELEAAKTEKPKADKPAPMKKDVEKSEAKPAAKDAPKKDAKP